MSEPAWVPLGGAAAVAPTIVRGVVSSTGALVSGSGFTSVRNALGDYTVTFSPALSAAPVVVLTPSSDGGGAGTSSARMPVIVARSTTTFRVTWVYANGGAAEDTGFHFQAIVP